MVASIPNIAHWRVLKDLILKDKWEYVQAGTLDRTHLRFFTKKGIKELFVRSGFEVIHLSKVPSARVAARLVDKLTLRMLERFLAFQYLVCARKYASH